MIVNNNNGSITIFRVNKGIFYKNICSPLAITYYFFPQKAKLIFSLLLPPTPEIAVQIIHQSNVLPAEKGRLSGFMVLQSSQGDFYCFSVTLNSRRVDIMFRKK